MTEVYVLFSSSQPGDTQTHLGGGVGLSWENRMSTSRGNLNRTFWVMLSHGPLKISPGVLCSQAGLAGLDGQVVNSRCCAQHSNSGGARWPGRGAWTLPGGSDSHSPWQLVWTRHPPKRQPFHTACLRGLLFRGLSTVVPWTAPQMDHVAD